MEPTRLRASPEQFAALIEFMERHGDLLRPQAGAQGRLKSDRLWNELTTFLNSMGGGVQKTQDKWKKVWADWKTKTKKKYMLIRRHASGTGGGPSSRQSLTALEERVVAVIGLSAVIGQPGILEQGFTLPSQPQPNQEPEPVEEYEEQLVLEVPNVNISQSILSPTPLSPPPPPPPPPPVSPSHAGAAPSAPPPLPSRTPPRGMHRQPASSPRSAASTPRRRLLRARRNRGLTPFDRAASEFVAVEQRRLQFEEARENRLHEREMERLRLESERIEATRENNRLMHQLTIIVQRLLETLSENRHISLASTDILPDTE